MKILVCQPKQEDQTEQLEREFRRNPFVDAVLFPEGYLRSTERVERACMLAKNDSATIITGYKDETNKDRAIIINGNGEVILERAKTLRISYVQEGNRNGRNYLVLRF